MVLIDFPQVENNIPSPISLHLKRYIAVERAAGCGHRDCAGGRAGGHFGFEISVEDDFEGCRRAVKSDAGRARQIVAQNLDDSPRVAKVWPWLHKRTESYVFAKDDATLAQSAASARGPVKNAVGALHHRGVWHFAV